MGLKINFRKKILLLDFEESVPYLCFSLARNLKNPIIFFTQVGSSETRTMQFLNK